MESTDLLWGVVSKQDEKHEKGERGVDAGDTYGWGSPEWCGVEDYYEGASHFNSAVGI